MRDADLEPTGRELADPAATLVECVNSEGLKHTVISFNEEYRGHHLLTTDVDLIMSFMAYPMVTGLVECNAADTKRARFSYPTGTIWTVKEVLRGFDQVNQQVGVRAAIELLYLGGMIIHEAGETGPLQGCFSHGNLNPWRIGLKADGQVQVFGYGLAQVEMYEFVHGAGEHVGHDSIRYAPPERLEGQPEQPSSDSYALAVMAYELITGKPLYDQKEPQKMWDAVKLAEGIQVVRNDKLVPKPVRSVLVDALTYDPDKRLSGMQLVESVGALLDDPKLEGRTLLQVMERMLNTGARSSRKLVKAATSAFSMDALKRLAEEADDVDLPEAEKDPEGGEESRWGAVTREGTTGRGGRQRRRRAEEGEEDSRRRRRRLPEAGGAPATEPPDAVEATDEDDVSDVSDGSDVPRKRRRKSRRLAEAEADVQTSASSDTSGATAPADEAEAAVPNDAPVPVAESSGADDADADDDGDGETPRRRRRKSRRSEPEPTVGEQVEATKAPEPEPEIPPVAETKDTRIPSPEETAADAVAVAQADKPAAPDVAGDDADDDADDGSDDAPDSPRRRRRRAAAPAPEELPESPRRRRRHPAPEEEAAALPDAPRRRRRRTPDEVQAEAPSDEPVPRRRRRRSPDGEDTSE